MSDDEGQSAATRERREPPAVYIPACGALCDIFWWARRENPSPVTSGEKVPDARKRAPGG
jgi:hypothetical protein